MKRIFITLSLTIVAVVALALLIGSVASGEIGWPINEADEPTNGGNWQGQGQMDIPPEGITAEWYNRTDGGNAWVIQDQDDITRSYSAFNYQHDLTIQDGGILRLDSVQFVVNSTAQTRRVVIESGGALYLTNSSFTGWEILVANGGALYIHPGNGTNFITIDSVGMAPGIVVSEGAIFELMNASMSGFSTLLTIEESSAIVRGTSFDTSTDDAACIHLKTSLDIYDCSFFESAPSGSYAIIAEPGITGEIYNNTFQGFKYGGEPGRAIVSYSPLEIYDNTFKKMWKNDQNAPYILYFVGVEPAEHEGEKVWDTNRFWGSSSAGGDEPVNIFKQAWMVDIDVTNNNTALGIEDALVELWDNREFLYDGTTDADGKVSFEIPEFLIRSMDDGKTAPLRSRNTLQLNDYKIEASKEGANDVLKDETIDMDRDFSLGLDLIQFDYGVTNLEFLPPTINAGDSIRLDATVVNDGYDLESIVTVEFWIMDAVRAEEKLGQVDVLVDKRAGVHAYLEDAPVDIGYADSEVSFWAKTVHDKDDNGANDKYTTDPVHINQKPTATIDTPTNGATITDSVNITGTADDEGMVEKVYINITGVMDWTVVDGTTNWYYVLNTKFAGLANGDYEINVRSEDDNGAFSDPVTIMVTVKNTPTVSIGQPTDGSLLWGNGTITMVGSATKLSAAITNVSVSIDGGAYIEATKTTGDWTQWTFALKTLAVDRINSLSDGDHVFTAKVVDGDMLEDTFSVTYTIYSMGEATKPDIDITTPTPVTISSDKWIEGTATDDYKVTDIQYRINDGDWSQATEIFDIDTTSASWRIQIKFSDKQLDEGANVLEIRAFDDDGNTTSTLPMTKPATGIVDLTVVSVVVQDADGNEPNKDDLKSNKILKVIVEIGVEIVGSDPLDVVEVSVEIGGIPAGEGNRTSVNGDFTHTFSIRLTESMIDKNSWIVKVDPANKIDEENLDGNAEQNNQKEGILPNKITKGSGSSGGEDDDDSGFLPGFEIVLMVAALGVASVFISRKRRE